MPELKDATLAAQYIAEDLANMQKRKEELTAQRAQAIEQMDAEIEKISQWIAKWQPVVEG